MTLAIHACKLRSQAKEWPANGPLPKPSAPLRPAIPAQMLPEVSSRFSNWHHLLEQQKQQSFSRTSSFRHPPLPPLDAIAPAQLRGPTSKSMPALQVLSSSCSRLSLGVCVCCLHFPSCNARTRGLFLGVFLRCIRRPWRGPVEPLRKSRAQNQLGPGLCRCKLLESARAPSNNGC